VANTVPDAAATPRKVRLLSTPELTVDDIVVSLHAPKFYSLLQLPWPDWLATEERVPSFGTNVRACNG
jgi:hypothetical protein